MTMPVITYPVELDTENNLYLVADALSISLAKDYTPGDSIIYVAADLVMMSRFPDSGIITLTEQCSEPEKRALSFYYTTKDNFTFTFTGLTRLAETPDSFKKSVVTKVTMNVTAQHHNNVKDAVLSIENFVGRESDSTTIPFFGNIVQRTKFLFKTVFTPRAWFISNKTRGIAPLTVLFTSKTLYIGEGIDGNEILYTWNMGDGTIYPNQLENFITHTYTIPGIYSVQLTVANDYGSDMVQFVNMIDCLWIAPFEAIIEIVENSGQKYFPAPDNYLKTPTNTYVYISTSNAEAPPDPQGRRTYAGAHLTSSGTQIDPITTFTWDLSDTLSHGNSPETKALYNFGGIYSVVLRCDTRSNSYRITTDAETINVIEKQNAWLFNFVISPNVAASELGFLNETFKTQQRTQYAVTRNSNFVLGYLDEERILKEFYRNTNFCAQATVPSGYQGSAVISWASGRNSASASSTETIKFTNFNGFDESYPANFTPTFYRPWNWINYNSTGISFYMLGNAVNQPVFTSPTNTLLQSVNLITPAISTVKNFSPGDFIGAASYLSYNSAEYDGAGVNIYGNYSSYRTAQRGRTLYILKNITVGSDFKIMTFFSTFEGADGIISGFKKLPDMVGPLKTQGQLVNLATGLFFFNNTGSVMFFDTVTNVWKTGGPGYNSVAFANLQDTSVTTYGNENNSLVATTDFSNNAFLSFDYSPNAFIKFNDVDLAFSKLNSRVAGEQWVFGSY
jgi:PKD repeat protein